MGTEGMSKITPLVCPTPCDPDCDADCHEAHQPTWKREQNHSHKTEPRWTDA